jgi:membrane-associated phospholipid phosphatase
MSPGEIRACYRLYAAHRRSHRPALVGHFDHLRKMLASFAAQLFGRGALAARRGNCLADNARFTNLPTLGRTTAEIVLALRDKTLGTIDFEAVNGIISFPSMHAAVAIIVPYTLRWNRWIFEPIAVLDSVMLASAVPSGNHYLADVIAGVAVAVLAIACGRAIQVSLDRLFNRRRRFDYARQRAYNP